MLAMAEGSKIGFSYTRKTAQPIKKPGVNFIPQQSWLSYNWIDKDPDLEFVIYAIQESGRSAEWIEEETAKFGHRVSRYTIINWCFGSVKRPQNASMNTVMAVLGWNREWRR